MDWSFAEYLWEGFMGLIFPQDQICPLCQNKPLKGAILCPVCLQEIIPCSRELGQCKTCGK